MSLSHFPTAILIIGYISYWLEVYFIKAGQGIASPLAYILAAVFLIFSIFSERQEIKKFFKLCADECRREPAATRFVLLATAIIIVGMLAVVFLTLLKPPHLPQEADSLKYHLTLPRQHLITGSFKHIWWSSADLFPLPIQFALSPYWFINGVPSRLIHFFFTVGLIAASVSLTMRLNKKSFMSACLVALAILGSHNVGIQMPVLMLDLILAYLFVACVDNLTKGAYFAAMIEFCFLFWSKSFTPFQLSAVIGLTLATAMSLRIFNINKYSCAFDVDSGRSIDKPAMFKILAGFSITSLFIGMPFIIKSTYYSGTPLYPFYPGCINIFPIDKNSYHWQSIVYASKMHFTGRDIYGSGRDILNFLRHIWLIAVPETKMGGVMNRYDYPIGMPYLLFIGPFIYFLFSAIKKKIFPILPVFAVFYWLTWWFGSQQSRFLYIPLLAIFISVAAKKGMPHKILIWALTVALTLNFISVFRAHKLELKLPAGELIRQPDKELMELNIEYYEQQRKDIVTLERFDISYAQFPAEVRLKGKNHWILEK